MKYKLNYQYLPKGRLRPIDDGDTVDILVDENQFALIPNAGDFVQIDNSMNGGASFNGRVKSRVFFYLQGKDGDDAALSVCSINIVVQETDDDWGELIKE